MTTIDAVKSEESIAVNKPIELKTNDWPIRFTGLMIVLGTFGLFGGWAALAPLDSAALAQGVVTVESYRKTIQHLEGGIVKELHVRDGDLVLKDDVLLQLDDTQVKAQLEIVRGQLFTAKALEARLNAEKESNKTIEFSELLTSSNDPRAIEAMDSQVNTFDARKSAREGEIKVLRQREEQLRSKVKGLKALQRSKKSLLASFAEETNDFRDLLTNGFADKQRVRQLERDSARLEGEIAELASNLAGTEIQIGETKLQVLQLMKQFQTEVADQLAEVNAKVFDLTERFDALSDTLRRTVIRAPESGMVLGMTIHTVGGVVQSGGPILDLVPQTGSLIIEAQLSPADIDKVSVGQMADIRFSVFKSINTTIIEGEVLAVSADRLVDKQSGVPYYLIRIRITDKGYETLGDLKLLPGMPAEVLVNIGERTLLEYLLQPATDAFARSFIEE